MFDEKDLAAYNKSCRACLEGTIFLPINDEFCAKFLEVTTISAEMDDGLSQLVCHECLNVIDQFKHYKDKCIKVDVKLRKALAEQTAKGTDDIFETLPTSTEDAQPTCSTNKTTQTNEVENEVENNEVENNEVENNEVENNEVENNMFNKENDKMECNDHDYDSDNKGNDGSVKIEEFDVEEKDQASLDDESDDATVFLRRRNRYTAPNIPRLQIVETYELPDGRYICNCGKVLNSLTQYDIHHSIHRTDESTCKQCRERFPNKEILRGHVLLHSSEDKMLSCHICSKKIVRECILMHIEKKHGRLKGKKCSVVKEDEPINSIKLPDRESDSESSDDYVKGVGEKMILNCTVCNRKFKHKEILEGHLLLHGSKDVSLKCPFCSKKFKRTRLLSHIRKIHLSNRMIMCKTCGKILSDSEHLKRHMRVHTGEKRFECDICGKYFRLKYTLNTHLNTHNPERGIRRSKMFSSNSLHCDICGKTYTNQSTYREHVEAFHETDQSFLCSLCGEVQNSKWSMILHKRKHRRVRLKEKSLQCKFCDMKFLFNTALVAHERVHTNERPFKCDICSSAFKSKSQVTRHMGIHTGVKNFKCDMCGKRFTTKSNVAGHMKLHTGERPFACKTCNKDFIHATVFKKHIREHH